MDIPIEALRRAARLMREQRGNEALNQVQDYGITTFTQLERWCKYYQVPTWREKNPEEPEVEDLRWVP